MHDSVFLTRVVLRNYKSFAACSVKLGPLTFLVGPNGAGKSNFLDALRIIAESLNMSLEHALRDRGGINEVRRRSSGHPTNFGIRLEFTITENSTGWFAFSVGAMKKGGFEVQDEECHVFGSELNNHNFYRVQEGRLIESSERVMPPVASDRLYLVAAAGLPGFREVYDALSHMGFYNFNPVNIRELQPPDTGILLGRDGQNIASVLNLMERENKEAYGKVMEFLSKIVTGVRGVTVKHMGKKETLEFRQVVGTNRTPWRFPAENMSDGTLRALGVLTALYQSFGEGERRIPFVGIEEPEVAVHPGAAGVLRDALIAASRNVQIGVTSHSPDILDDKDISDDWILGVVNENGDTKIGPIDPSSRSAIKDRLYTAGELLRFNQLSPDTKKIKKISPAQLELFGGIPK
ncbi:MAG: AAA family ATPase [Candidatus Latescibacter sp.]|nr:AAA family ATPase [Candidatus Latescibacter sp.]